MEQLYFKKLRRLCETQISDDEEVSKAFELISEIEIHHISKQLLRQKLDELKKQRKDWGDGSTYEELIIHWDLVECDIGGMCK